MALKEYITVTNFLLIALTVIIILMGYFVWIPTAIDYKAIRADEMTFFSGPTYCKIQKMLCDNETPLNLSQIKENLTIWKNNPIG